MTPGALRRSPQAGRVWREHPQRLGDEGRARHALEGPEEVGKDVGVVDAHVEGDRSRLADMTPRTDDDGVVAPNVRLNHQVELAEEPLFDHGTGEPVRGISAIVLRGGQHRTGSCSRVDDRAARADGDPERLLADHVQPSVERRSSDEVMDGRVGDDVERLHGPADDQLLVVR